MEIRCVKLIGGDEIIFQFDNYSTVEDVRCLNAINPVAFGIMQDPETGRPVTGFAEWPKLAEKGQTQQIPMTSLLNMPTTPNPELAAAYYQSFSGIVLPPTAQKILLG